MLQQSLPPTIKKRKLQLCFWVLVFLLIGMLLPRNYRWLEERILPYLSEFGYQVHHQDIEERKRDRWGSAYVISCQIDTVFSNKGIKDKVLVLIPPRDYFKAKGISYKVPEPAVFYYYTGLRTTWVNSSAASLANWYVRVQDGQLLVEPVHNRKAFLDSLAVFKKFRTEL